MITLFPQFLQLKSYGLSYFNFGNLLEWVLYTLTVLFVLPLSDIQYITGIHIRMVSKHMKTVVVIPRYQNKIKLV